MQLFYTSCILVSVSLFWENLCQHFQHYKKSSLILATNALFVNGTKYTVDTTDTLPVKLKPLSLSERKSGDVLYYRVSVLLSGQMAQLLRRETSCFEPLLSGFTRAISGQGKIMNVPVFYHEVNMVL